MDNHRPNESKYNHNSTFYESQKKNKQTQTQKEKVVPESLPAIKSNENEKLNNIIYRSVSSIYSAAGWFWALERACTLRRNATAADDDEDGWAAPISSRIFPRGTIQRPSLVRQFQSIERLWSNKLRGCKKYTSHFRQRRALHKSVLVVLKQDP